MSRGSGNSLGEALIDAWAAASGGRPLKSYDAKGWHAQISKLTSQPRGYAAAERAGLDVTPRTLRGWLSEATEPNAANRSKIAKAYDIMAGRTWNAAAETGQYEIRGLVQVGTDVRDRGSKGTAPFRIDGSNGQWNRIREHWLSGELTPDLAEDLFGEDVINEDVGESTEPWEFPGNYYEVTF